MNEHAGPDPRVGVVILTHNRLDDVTRTIARMQALPEQPTIVVVDNGSSDGTPDLLRRRFPDVRCLALGENRGAAGRNAGVQTCVRSYVVLCDDDVWWEPGALRRAADLLDAFPRLAVVVGRVLVGPENRPDPTSQEMAASPIRADVPLPGPAVLGFLAGASMVRRSAFLAVGGFEPRFFIGGEEELLTLDVVSRGWELAYVDDVVVHHHPSAAGRDPARRRRTMARNRLWVTWMRRPARTALLGTARALGLALRDRVTRDGLAEALLGLPWALRRRRVVPRSVEHRLRQLDVVERDVSGLRRARSAAHAAIFPPSTR